MKSSLVLPLALAACLLNGCATQSMRQGNDLSTSGILYTDAVDKMVDITIDCVINFDSQELIKTRRGSDLRTLLGEKNNELIAVITELNEFKAQTRLLKTYFINLQALSDSTIKDDAGAAVKSLSDSISSLNTAFEKKKEKHGLSEEQKEHIGTLGGLIVHSAQADKIKNALRRDAAIIGESLILQENQLRNIADMLSDRFLTENDLFLNEKVIAPYTDRNTPLPASWPENRKQWLKTHFINEQLAATQNAARQLQGIWEDILQGRSDIHSLSIAISDINELAITLQGLAAASAQ